MPDCILLLLLLPGTLFGLLYDDLALTEELYLAAQNLRAILHVATAQSHVSAAAIAAENRHAIMLTLPPL